MKTVIVIQARLRSTRLPGKILLPLPTGRVVLEEVISRCRQARRAHQIVVAVPDHPDSEVLVPYTGGATVVYGPEDDVLARYALAAETVGADIVVRITSDCPCVPAVMIDAVIERRNVHALPYACNILPETWPQGYACEAFTMNLLREHAANSWSKEAREHVTHAMRLRARGDKVNVACPDGDYSDIRWTLDDISDYVRIVRAFEGAKGASNLLEIFGNSR
jgi:spore coat polysaccharide biosynthesis protein SpsF